MEERNIKRYNEFIKEGLRSKLKANSSDTIKQRLSQMEVDEWIEEVRNLKLDKSYLPPYDQFKEYLQSLDNVEKMIDEIKFFGLGEEYYPSEEEIKEYFHSFNVGVWLRKHKELKLDDSYLPTEKEIEEYKENNVKLLEDYIVLTNKYDDDTPYKITHRDNFKEERLCNTYGDFGQVVGCNNAGCYTLGNSESDIHKDLVRAIEEEFGIELNDVIEEHDVRNYSFDGISELRELIDEINEDEDLQEEINHIFDVDNIIEFAKKWVGVNELHTDCTAWDYWDGSNHKSFILHIDYGESDVKEVDEELSIDILNEYPGQFHIDGAVGSEETEYFIFHESRYSNNPWLAEVETKNNY